MKEKILFVTKGGENCDEDFQYVLELAKALHRGIAVLMIYPRQMMSSFDDVMSAAAFAEAGDFKTVRTLLDSQEKALREAEKTRADEMSRKAAEAAVDLIFNVTSGDVGGSVKEYMKACPGIDMVLLSPTLAGNKKLLDIKKLVKNISKPIVNITVPIKAEEY
jgi:nucleotide-binding universal stress UspA family protein